MTRYIYVRTTDPDTSHDAADALDLSLNERVLAAVEVVREAGELTHKEIGWRMWERGLVPDPEAGRRAARTATDCGVLVGTGRKAQNRFGHQGYTFKLAP